MASRLRKIVINEVSLVDRGANQHANITLWKRDGSKELAVKREGNEPDNEVKKMTDAEIAELQKRLEKAEAMAKLSDEERAFMGTLPEAERDTFAKADQAVRKGRLDDVKSKNETVYTSTDGEVFRKSDDPRLVAMAKRLDAERRVTAEARDAAETERLAKRARDEFPTLPGTDAEKAGVLKGIEAMPKEQREKALAMLKAGEEHAQNSAYFSKVSANRGGKGGDAETQLDTLAKSYQKDNKNVTYEVAYAKVLETPEGASLYEQTIRN